MLSVSLSRDGFGGELAGPANLRPLGQRPGRCVVDEEYNKSASHDPMPMSPGTADA